MKDIFFQGEDIAINVEIFEDDLMSSKISTINKIIKLVAYTKSNFIIKFSTSPKDDELAMSNTGDSLRVVIPANSTKQFSPGPLFIELMFVDNGTKNIVISSNILIESSVIGNLN